MFPRNQRKRLIWGMRRYKDRPPLHWRRVKETDYVKKTASLEASANESADGVGGRL